MLAPHLGPRADGPLKAADEVDAGRTRSEVGGARRRADGRRRDAVEAVDVVLDVADDRADDEARALAFLPLADVPAATTRSDHGMHRSADRSSPATTGHINPFHPFPSTETYTVVSILSNEQPPYFMVDIL